jgi:hypothetical protein
MVLASHQNPTDETRLLLNAEPRNSGSSTAVRASFMVCDLHLCCASYRMILLLFVPYLCCAVQYALVYQRNAFSLAFRFPQNEPIFFL